jgi:hypothetical protein
MSVALAQDLLILVFRFVAENYRYRSRRRREAVLGRPVDLADRYTEDPEIRAWKALLRLSRPDANDTSRLSEMDIAAQGFEPDVLANIYGTLNNLGRQSAVWRDRKDNFVIENSAMRAIERELQMLEGQTPTDGDNLAQAVEWQEQRESTYLPASAGQRRAAAGGAIGSPPAASSAIEQRAVSRSTRRGRLREFLTGSLEPRSERMWRAQRDPLIRLSGVKRVEKPTDLPAAVDVPHRDVAAVEPVPERTRSENPFDYISRFTPSTARNSD